MKTLSSILLFLGIALLVEAQDLPRIGMTLEEFGRFQMKMDTSRYENTLALCTNANIYGLKDKYCYRFTEKDGTYRMDWIYFHKYIDELTQENFDLCLKATRNMIEEFTINYSKPDEIIVGDTTFVDPYKKHHWGYDVIEARWKNYQGMKIKVEFTFMGGKGEYSLLVQIHWFDKDYPYYD